VKRNGTIITRQTEADLTSLRKLLKGERQRY
jgi:hypothetical protein